MARLERFMILLIMAKLAIPVASAVTDASPSSVAPDAAVRLLRRGQVAALS